MDVQKKKIAIIGAGPMGLACAYHLVNQNYVVDVYEADDRLGGMSASFDFDGLTIERYYHFICKTDTSLFELLDELNLSDKLRWHNTKMGFYYQGKLYPWGSPMHLLTFPKLNFISKLRYALHVFYTKSVSNWDKLDQQSATTWIRKWIGDKAYYLLWDYLFEMKFYEYKHNISAAWIGTRIKRIALSRKNLLTETLGYLENGSDTLLNALQQAIEAKQGNIYLQRPIEEVVMKNDQVQGIKVNGELLHYDTVMSTVPLPYVPRIMPKLPQTVLDKIQAIQNCGVVCVILKLSQPLTVNFWLNINDENILIPGLIEYTNLSPLVDHILYAPFYMPHTHAHYKNSNEYFLEATLDYCQRVNPEFSQDWVKASRVSRYDYAQPICSSDFYNQLPAIKTPIEGLLIADTSYYYPEDRSISESVQLGKSLAKLLE